MISNSLDIDFIHGDIHGRSCKKSRFWTHETFRYVAPTSKLAGCLLLIGWGKGRVITILQCTIDGRTWEICCNINCNISIARLALDYIRSVVPHYNNVIMSAMAFQITRLTTVYSNVYSGTDKKPSKLRVTGLCAGNSPVNSPYKWPVTWKMFPFDDVIMGSRYRGEAQEITPHSICGM